MTPTIETAFEEVNRQAMSAHNNLRQMPGRGQFADMHWNGWKHRMAALPHGPVSEGGRIHPGAAMEIANEALAVLNALAALSDEHYAIVHAHWHPDRPALIARSPALAAYFARKEAEDAAHAAKLAEGRRLTDEQDRRNAPRLLLDRLASRGIVLTVDDDDVLQPLGAKLEPDELVRIVERKAEIVELIAADAAASRTARVIA